jgi:hypothetical protein
MSLNCRRLLLVVLGAALCPMAAENPTQPVPEPYREVYFEAFEPGTRWNWHLWDRNYLIVWTAESQGPTVPSLAIYDSDGKLVRDVIVWVPGVDQVFIHRAAVTPSGLIVLTVGALKGETVANFIAAIDHSGEMKYMIRTNPFIPVHVCVAEDGTIWTLGWEKRKGPPGDLLRHYSFEKGELRTTLNRGRLPRKFGMFNPDVAIRCGKDKVYLYVGVSNQFIEYDVAADRLSQWHLTPLPYPDVRFRGFAATENGEVFAGFRGWEAPLGPRAGMFRLERQATGKAQWVPVPGMEFLHRKDKRIFDILGSDGADLVFQTAVLPPKVSWAHVKAFGATEQR